MWMVPNVLSILALQISFWITEVSPGTESTLGECTLLNALLCKIHLNEYFCMIHIHFSVTFVQWVVENMFCMCGETLLHCMGRSS